MRFLKIQAKLLNNANEKDSENSSQFARKMQSVSEMVYQRFRHRAYCFVEEICVDNITMCAIVMEKKLFDDVFNQFCSDADIRIDGVRIEEVTFDAMYSLLTVACVADYVCDDTDVLKKFDMEELSKTGCREFMIEGNMNQEELMEAARKELMEATLGPELERIFAAGTRPAYGHPVHYMVMTNDDDVRNHTIEILATALYLNRRIENKRYMRSVVTNHWFDAASFECMFRANAGGVLVYDFRTDDENKNEYAGIAVRIFDGVCDAMRKHRNETLTIFCIPRDSKRIQRAIRERIGNTSLIEIREGVVSGDRARRYLTDKARDHGVEPDERLFIKVSESKGSFIRQELNEIFDIWYDMYLKTEAYPQYRMIEAANSGQKKIKPKGNSYAELKNMVGLTKIKNIVETIIAFYKMQRLYKDQNILCDQITMHMVFTGNPGTAKTTVARLLCGILKDNEIISSGAFVEVGRADLVGKFVGWTAQIVKEKFEEAKGGVLFIDEAYSLLDDKGGMFGDEAINTVVQCMENQRADVIVIFAGYPREMEKFVSRNPGLRSRIAITVDFDNYTPQELWQISLLTAARSGMKIDAAAKARLLPLFEREMKSEDFGNGRYVRNLVDKARMNQASRLAREDPEHMTKEKLSLLRAEDFEVPKEQKKKERAIGFMAKDE